MDQREYYGFDDILELTGVSRSRLTHWLDRQYISPDIEDSQGPGRSRGHKHSFRNVVEVAVARVLAESGLEWLAIAMTLDHLRRAGIWDRLSHKSTRARAAFLLLPFNFPVQPTNAGFETSGDLERVPSPTITSAEKAGGVVLKQASTLCVNLEMILSAMERKTGDTLKATGEK